MSLYPEGVVPALSCLMTTVPESEVALLPALNF